MGAVSRLAMALLWQVALTALLPAGTSNAQEPPDRGARGDDEVPRGRDDRKSAIPKGQLSFGGKPVRIEVRPRDSFLPARTTQIFLATVYDDRGQPVRRSKVEWAVDGVGDLAGSADDAKPAPPGRSGIRYIAGTTASAETTKTVDGLSFVVRPGQTWIALRSAVEGQTAVTVDCPEMDKEIPRKPVKVLWVDAKWKLPAAQKARAGTEATLKAQVFRMSDERPLPGYLVRYRILEGPTAQWAGSTYQTGAAEAIATTDAKGVATLTLKQPAARTGVNRIGITVARPDPANRENVVLGKGELLVTWEAPDLSATLTAPPYAPVRGEFSATLSVANGGSADSKAVFARLNLPAGVKITSSSERCTKDGSEVLWALPPVPADKQITLQVTMQADREGTIRPAFNIRAADGQSVDAYADIAVGEPALQIQLRGPANALVSEESLPFELLVRNAGTGPTEAVECELIPDAGLSAAGGPESLRATVPALKAGESRTLAIPLKAEKAGRFAVRATAQGKGIPFASAAPVAVEVAAPALAVTLVGPESAFVNRPVEWTLRAENPSDVDLANVDLQAVLPPEVKFSSASRDGRFTNGTVEWKLGSLAKGQSAEVRLAGTCLSATSRAIVSASATADPQVRRDGVIRTVSLTRAPRAEATAPRALEILGVPALQMEVTDTVDPVAVGKRTSFAIRIRNTGSLAATELALTGSVSKNLKALSSAGPREGEVGTANGATVEFPVWGTLQPGEEIVYRVTAEALAAGEGRFRAELRSHSQSRPIVVEELTSVRP